MNIACIGIQRQPRPSSLGGGGAPATPSTTPAATGCQTTPAGRSWKVDYVSRRQFTHDRAAARVGPAYEIRRVVSNLGVFDFETPTTRCACAGPPRRDGRGREATWFSPGRPRRRAESRPPTGGTAPHPRVIDPNGFLARSGAGMSDTRAHRVVPRRPFRTPVLRPGRGRVPDRADRHGLVAGPPGRRLRQRRHRHPSPPPPWTTTSWSAPSGSHRKTDKPFGVNRGRRPDAGERIDLLIREGGRSARSRGPKPDLIKKLKDASVVVMPSIGAKRHAEKVAEWGVDAVLVQGGEGGGYNPATSTSLLRPRWSARSTCWRSPPAASLDAGRAWCRTLVRRGGVAMAPLPADVDSTSPATPKQVYLETGRGRHPPAPPRSTGAHRVLRTELRGARPPARSPRGRSATPAVQEALGSVLEPDRRGRPCTTVS